MQKNLWYWLRNEKVLPGMIDKTIEMGTCCEMEINPYPANVENRVSS
jgi:hypothetical protein